MLLSSTRVYNVWNFNFKPFKNYLRNKMILDLYIDRSKQQSYTISFDNVNQLGEHMGICVVIVVFYKGLCVLWLYENVCNHHPPDPNIWPFLVYFYWSYPDILVQFQMIHKNATVHRPSKNKYDEKLNLSCKIFIFRLFKFAWES